MRKTVRKTLIVAFLLILLLALSVSFASASGGGNYHTVRYGETLFSIGRLYGVYPYAIAQANGLYNPNRIYAGQVLYIPSDAGWNRGDNCGRNCGNYWDNVNYNDGCSSGDCSGYRGDYNDGCSSGGCSGYQGDYNDGCSSGGCSGYRGDYNDGCSSGGCSGYRGDYNDWNRGSPGSHQPGCGGGNYHRVVRGETLTRIAYYYGVSPWAIARANGIYNLNRIYAGQCLHIPSTGGQADYY